MKNAEDVAEKITYNVIESICHVVDRNIYSESILKKVSPDVAKALQDAYRKGEEDMRERAAEVVIKEHETCQEWGCEISNKILSLPLTEGGAK